MKDNGKTDNKQELVIPAIMQSNQNVENIANQLKRDMSASRNNVDSTKFQVMEGMQNKDKVGFFTEYTNFDDVMRMNTIEMYGIINIKITRKINPKFKDRLDMFYKDVYDGHSVGHKINMSALNRGREMSYTKILSNDNTEQSVSKGWERFFGIGGKKK